MDDPEFLARADQEARSRMERNPPSAPAPHSHVDWLADVRDFLAKDLFFVGSFPKSGSTWLQVMLNAHPEVACRGEGHFFDHFWPLLEDALKKHNGLIDLKNKTIFEEFEPFPRFDQEHMLVLMATSIALLLGRSKNVRERRVLGEKTPNNLLHLTQLDAVFPRAKFVQVIRDGRDCAVSAWFHNQRTNPSELQRRHGTFARFSEHIARIWSANVEIGLRFAASRPGRCLIVRYEDLCRDPAAELRALFGFLDVDTGEALLRHCATEGRFEKMSGGRSPGVEDRGSFLRRGVSGDWRNHFSIRTNRAFFAIAGDVMGRVGYHR
jgi:hypothetical protein